MIERAIEPDAQRRYQTAGEMQAALDRFLASPDDRDSDDLSWIPMPKPLVARLRRMGRTRALALAVAAGVACLALGAGIAWQTFRHTATLGVAGPPNVIAVIDLARGNGVADYEAAGVTEGIHDLLSTSDALRVVSRRSVQVVSQQQLSTPELAKRLGADTLIEGRLERVAQNYQLSLRLIRAGSDQSLALGTFTAPISQRLGLSQPAAEAVAKALRTPLPSMPRPRLHATGGLASDAQEKYARARYYLNTAGNWDHRNLSARLFEEAIAIAPDFAEAHSGLARTYYAMINHPREDAKARLAQAREHAEHALRLDSSLPEAHAVMGVVAFYDWRWEDAEREFTKAVMLSPSNEFAVERYAMFLAARGRVQEGITQLMKVRRLDPLSPFVAYSLASLLTYDGRYDEALVEVQRARSLDPADTACTSCAAACSPPRDATTTRLTASGTRWARSPACATRSRRLARRKPARGGAARRSGLRSSSKTTQRATRKSVCSPSCSDTCMRNWAITIGRSRGSNARSTNGPPASFG